MITKYAHIIKKLPTWLYKFAAKRYIDRAYPRHLFVETTASCNLTCSYCPREKIRQDMDFNLFREIVDEATRYGARSFSLHLFGEPLLYPRIFEAIKYIKSRNKRHTILLTTNGTKINDCIDDFVHSGIDQAIWTWRPEARFRDTTLLKLKKWGKFRVRFIHEITPKEELLKWENWPNKEDRNIHNYGGNISGYGLTENSKERWPCYHLWLAPAVAWNGKILICCSDPHQKEVIGEFPKETVHQAWIGKKLAEIRQSHRDGKYYGVCKNCDVWKQYPKIF